VQRPDFRTYPRKSKYAPSLFGQLSLEFDDEGSRLVEEFNTSAGAKAQRIKITKALALKSGYRVLDVGSGPENQVFEMSSVVDDIIAMDSSGDYFFNYNEYIFTAERP